MLEVAGDLDAGRVVVVIANFASNADEITLNISKLGVVSKTCHSSVLDLVSLRNESMPCARTMDHKCVELQVALPAASIRVIELTTQKTPVQQRCRDQLDEYFVANATFMGLANYTPSCSQEPPLCREHLPPPCVDLNSEQKTKCTNSVTPLNLTVSLPSLNSSAAPRTGMLVRLGLLAKKYHRPGPPPENSWYLNTDIGRWRLDNPDGQSVEFDGAAFVELRLPTLATHGGQLTLALSFLGNSTGSPPTTASDRRSLNRPIRGAPNTSIPPVRTLMFASVVLESRSCDDTIGALKVDDEESTKLMKADDALAHVDGWDSSQNGSTHFCINGEPSSVFAWINPNSTVISPGSVSPTLSICVTPGNCAFFAQPPSNGSSPPPPPIQLAQGPQSTNCSINPTWCRANQASIEMCSFDLGIGDAQTIFKGTAQPAGKSLSGTVLTFAGRKTIAAAITKLGTLGMQVRRCLRVYPFSASLHDCLSLGESDPFRGESPEQHDDLCTPEYVADFVVPLQRTYLQQAMPAATKAGNSGFLHSCYLGSYFNENFGTTSPTELPRAVDGVWNQIAIGGVTKQASDCEVVGARGQRKRGSVEP